MRAIRTFLFSTANPDAHYAVKNDGHISVITGGHHFASSGGRSTDLRRSAAAPDERAADQVAREIADFQIWGSAKIKIYAHWVWLSKTRVFERRVPARRINGKTGKNASQNSFLILASRKA